MPCTGEVRGGDISAGPPIRSGSIREARNAAPSPRMTAKRFRVGALGGGTTIETCPVLWLRGAGRLPTPSRGLRTEARAPVLSLSGSAWGGTSNNALCGRGLGPRHSRSLPPAVARWIGARHFPLGARGNSATRLPSPVRRCGWLIARSLLRPRGEARVPISLRGPSGDDRRERSTGQRDGQGRGGDGVERDGPGKRHWTRAVARLAGHNPSRRTGSEGGGMGRLVAMEEE